MDAKTLAARAWDWVKTHKIFVAWVVGFLLIADMIAHDSADNGGHPPGWGVGFVLAALIMGAMTFLFFWVRGNRAPDREHVRGARVVETRELAKLTRKNGAGSRSIRIGGVPIPQSIEPQHFLLSGAPGTGKSVTLGAMLAAIRERGERCIVVDPAGEFRAKFERPGDKMLNPYRGAGDWSPFSEMSGPWDAERLARSIIPDRPGEPNSEWQHYAQQLVAAVLGVCQQSGRGYNQDLLNYLVHSDSESLGVAIGAHPASQIFSKDAGRMAASVRAIVGTYLSPYAHLDPSAGASSFSIQKWVREGSGWLWLPFTGTQRDSLKTLIASWLDVAIAGLMDLPPDRDRRVWIFCDELPSLGRIQSIQKLTAECRKFGGVAVGGVQSMSQLREVYGRDGAQSLLATFGSWLTLRAGDSETAEYLSRHIGEAEIKRTTQSGHTSTGNNSEGWSQQVAREAAVMPSQLMSLPDLAGYLSLAGDYPTAKVRIELPGKRR